MRAGRPSRWRGWAVMHACAEREIAVTTDAEDHAPAELTGAELVVRTLVDLGVEVVFGYPGGAVLPIYDAIFKQNELRHILVRHEQGAVHAAEGYARSTGKVGTVLVTSGPGATNSVTGLTDALMDSIPVVCLTGQVPTHMIGKRRVSGSRHGGDHAALHQAQLPGEGGRPISARRDPRGLLHRGRRPARPGGGRPAEGHRHGQGALRRGRRAGQRP